MPEGDTPQGGNRVKNKKKVRKIRNFRDFDPNSCLGVSPSGMSPLIERDPGLTAFQKKVLLTVLKIPRGETRSYAWVARRINSRAYRAVGQALRKNPYAPHVPCHRVIASDGSIGGYSVGVHKKRKLLQEETGTSQGGDRFLL